MAAPRFPLGRTSPRLVKKAKGGKIWNNRHKYGMELYSEGVSCGECEDRVYGQRLCTGELWEFIMNSVAPYKINLFPYCLGIWYIMRAMFVVFFLSFFSPQDSRWKFFFYISINNSHVHSGSLGMSVAMKMLKQKTKTFFFTLLTYFYLCKNII